MVREAVLLSGITELAVMKMDILDGLKTIKVCTAYKYKGKILKEFPQDLEVLENVVPIYKELPGWTVPVTGVKNYKDLPQRAKDYLKYLEDVLKAKIAVVSVGSSRDETIFV